jgi:hypothetical protein
MDPPFCMHDDNAVCKQPRLYLGSPAKVHIPAYTAILLPSLRAASPILGIWPWITISHIQD